MFARARASLGTPGRRGREAVERLLVAPEHQAAHAEVVQQDGVLGRDLARRP